LQSLRYQGQMGRSTREFPLTYCAVNLHCRVLDRHSPI